MAEDIHIPSPSVFLRASPSPPRPRDDQPPVAKARRQPSTTTKKAPVRKQSTTAAAADGPPKPKQSKSRNGCVTCKAKRLKCGEEKPGCQQCAKRKVECGGYRKDFKWRPFEETNVKVNIDRQKRASPPRQTTNDNSTRKDSLATSSAPDSQARPAKAAKSSASSRDSGIGTFDEKETESPETQLPQRPAARRATTHEVRNESRAISPIAEGHESGPTTGSAPDTPLSPLSKDTSSVPITGISPRATYHNRSLSAGAAVQGSFVAGSPTLTEILAPTAEVSLEDGDYVPFQMPEDYHLPLDDFPDIGPLPDDHDLPHDDIEEILRSGQAIDDPQLAWAARYMAPLSDQDESPNSEGAVETWNGFMYNQPVFAEDSPEMLSLRFDRYTCGILSVMDGPNENPWRTLIWPLALNSPALYHAVLAMTSYHGSSDFPRLRLAGHEHKSASIRYIQEGIRDHSMTDQTAIATALALGFSESWDQHTATGNTHIKGAQALVKRTLADHRSNPLQGEELSRLKFLCNAWVYMDVIARLTSVDSDESNDFDNTFLFSSDAPQMIMGEHGIPGFGIDFGMPIDARVDPLMGCAGTLFPLVGRVANLVRKVCRSMKTSPALISQANDLKIALETWDPPTYIEPPEDPTAQVQHMLQTAEAYRWATLLHLHRSVPELPSLPSTELAEKALSYLATVPLASRTVVVQIYPLMVAGCEAVTSEDRQWIRERWRAMGLRMRIGVIDKCALVTEEVWRRKNAYEAQPGTSRRLVATSELQPVRRHGEPLKRTRSGFEDADPGRKGMVYSWVEGEGAQSGECSGTGSPDSNSKADGERFPRRPKPLPLNIGKMDPAYTVRGHLHWVGVMWDWGWEVLLG